MKLFGNKRGAARLRKRAGGPGSGSAGKRRLTGLQRGLLLLALCLVVLTGTVVAVYKFFVRPVEIPQPETKPVAATTEEAEEAEETYFVPPMVVQVQTEVDEETGE